MQNCLKNVLALNLPFITNQFLKSVLKSVDNSDGFNGLYKWCDIHDAFAEAKRTRKPIFLLIHNSWCPACKKLKNKISKSLRLIDLSKNFIMVKVENTADKVNKSRKFYPDGKYIPRILFFTPDGELIREAYNRSPDIDRKNRYYYNTPAQIIDTMNFVLKLISEQESPNPEEYETENIENPSENPDFHEPIVSS